jgi:hypothetical protein
MKPARLTSELLARKGGAAPLAGAYGGTGLEPLIGLFGRGAGRLGVVEATHPRPEASEPPRGAAVEPWPSPVPPHAVAPYAAADRTRAARATVPDAAGRRRAAPGADRQRGAAPQAPASLAEARRNAPARLSLHLDVERHMRLRIVAARKGARPQDLLRQALDGVLAAATDECPCVRGELPCCKTGS